ncbi:hypothetical protein [Nitrosococcus wardiae]|uniref:HEPN domain-containing protein n=1 Tax=Nitrosococcus wardiae TaxID=1814290 RepID=A0A4P7BXD5_9GAMM|nr:hypothetical protein [Nitrosococcus wardiae]QBQ53839.1 hypothetical protein E3U44_04410 [Nitrosococcus wardiae]
MTEGFFDLSTPEDLFGKLKHDFDELKSNPSNSWKAYDFFVTATHIADWIYEGNRRKTREFRGTHLILKVCDHLACSGKHFRLDNPAHRSVEKAEREYYVEPGYVESGYYEEPLVVTFNEAEKTEFGIKSENVVSLASRVMEFWENYFNDNAT